MPRGKFIEMSVVIAPATNASDYHYIPVQAIVAQPHNIPPVAEKAAVFLRAKIS
jgi:hypothetical protein